jgi:DNA processing protein
MSATSRGHRNEAEVSIDDGKPGSIADDDLQYWLRLEQTKGIGPQTARKLLSVFGLPQNIFAAGVAELCRAVPDKIAHELAAPPSEALQDLIERSIAWASQPGNRILSLADAHYPKALLDIPDPPLLLYVKGRLELLSRPALALVGSRNATAQGIANAEKFSESLGQAGYTIVSGLALGIDTAAHQGALRAADDASTIAVIGTGTDIVYPARNRALAHRIAEQGCIVSEYPLGTPAISSNFPRRNRIISGLARGVLVVEAAAQSGSLITARMAAEQGREVFAIPGSIHSPLSKGCHQLIKQGAKLVESAQDILEELGQAPNREDGRMQTSASQGLLADAADPLLTLMGYDPVQVDVLIARSCRQAAEIHAELLKLELGGSIERLPGDVYRRLT